jgi:hypothetical protein
MATQQTRFGGCVELYIGVIIQARKITAHLFGFAGACVWSYGANCSVTLRKLARCGAISLKLGRIFCRHNELTAHPQRPGAHLISRL